MTTASQLREALLSLAKPTPKQLPPALAGVFPPGCYIRARTAAEDVALEAAIATIPDGLTQYAKGARVLMLQLAFSLCDSKGDLVCNGDPSPIENIPADALQHLIPALNELVKNEQAEQGKD